MIKKLGIAALGALALGTAYSFGVLSRVLFEVKVLTGYLEVTNNEGFHRVNNRNRY